MFLVLEIAGILALGGFVLVLFKASNARPDDNGLRIAARLGLGAWIVFAIWSLVDFGYVWGNFWGLAQGALILVAIGILGFCYWKFVAEIRNRSDS